MACTALSRRQIVRWVVTFAPAAAVVSFMPQGPALADSAVELRTASRLSPLTQKDYDPPTNLSTVLDIYRRMTAPVRVDGKGPFPFVVDTGANQSVISQELAVQLGLTTGSIETLNGVAGVQDTATTRTTLGVGRRDENDVILSILPQAAIGGVGMLGLDHLEGRRLTLDFRTESLLIEGGGRARRDPDAIAVRAHRRDGQLTLIDVDLAGIPLIAILDSGAQNTIGNEALRQLALTRRPQTLWSHTPIISATGQSIDADFADLPALRIGGLRLPNWPVAFADLHTFRMWNLTRQPAILLGVDILSRFESVCLDFARDEVRFRLPQRNVTA